MRPVFNGTGRNANEVSFGPAGDDWGDTTHVSVWKPPRIPQWVRPIVERLPAPWRLRAYRLFGGRLVVSKRIVSAT